MKILHKISTKLSEPDKTTMIYYFAATLNRPCISGLWRPDFSAMDVMQRITRRFEIDWT